MIAYNREWLSHLNIREKAEAVFYQHLIVKDELDIINKKYEAGFYTPNIFIRIGLFILTIIIGSFSFGLLGLLFVNGIGNMLTILAIVFAVAAYAVLEYMVQSKNHYTSGVDDGLIWMGSIALFCGTSLPNDFGGLANCILLFIISLLATLRYADKLMAVVTIISFLGILFYSCIEMAAAAKAILPFIIMLLSLAIYFLVKKLQRTKTAIYYYSCLQTIEITVLVCLYAAGNYFIVREGSNELFHLNLQAGDSIPFGWLFWLLTILIPMIYLVRGIRLKEAILIRVGLVMFAAIVFSIRYYHTLLPVEVLMSIGGIALLIIAIVLMKWLHENINGFTSRELTPKNKMGKFQLESLVMAQTFQPVAGTSDQTNFGGGSVGGGGASGEY